MCDCKTIKLERTRRIKGNIVQIFECVCGDIQSKIIGTIARKGEECGKSKLTNEIVQDIQSGKTWKHIL